MTADRKIDTPLPAYEDLYQSWCENRAILGGERHVKAYDLELEGEERILLPFSPDMDYDLYAFLIGEAELPGICQIFAKMLVSGLLRKKPTLVLPEVFAEEANDWIMHNFGRQGDSLTSFLDEVLWEEMQTSRAWIYVAHPNIAEDAKLTTDERALLAPYPILWKAENIINWSIGDDGIGNSHLQRVLVKGFTSLVDPDSEFHDIQVPTIWVHEVVEGFYQIRTFQKLKKGYELTGTNVSIMKRDERLTRIPAWPANGEIEAREPMMSTLVAKEKALYNKVARRNHLLYGAATYTPILYSDMGPEDFDLVLRAGLGTMWKLPKDDKVEILETPTKALKDMENSIASGIEEMAKLGVRMLTPEVSQSGIALEIRNAAQTAQLGSLSERISSVMAHVILFMLEWRYDAEADVRDLDFNLTEDFNPIPLGNEWLRLATEWYQEGLIPRSIWLLILKSNDMIDPDYDDEEGKLEIAADELINRDEEVNDFDKRLD